MALLSTLQLSARHSWDENDSWQSCIEKRLLPQSNLDSAGIMWNEEMQLHVSIYRTLNTLNTWAFVQICVSFPAWMHKRHQLFHKVSPKFNTLCLMDLCQKSHVRKKTARRTPNPSHTQVFALWHRQQIPVLAGKGASIPCTLVTLCAAETSAHSPLYLCSKLRHREPLQYSVTHTQILGLTNNFSRGQKMAINKSLNIIY